MKYYVAAVALTVLAASPASAKMMSCSGANMAKSVAASNSMPESPAKWAMMKEVGMANTQMSKGDMRGACKSYMRAQKAGMMQSKM